MNILKKALPWILFVALIVGLFMWSKALQSGPTDGKLDEFAKCVSENGLTMYGAYWCPHCKEEKKRFGSSFEYVNYVECTENEQLCMDKGVKGYPTWIRTSTSSTSTERFEGEQGLEKLSEITSCPLPL